MKTILRVFFVIWYFNQIVNATFHRALIFDRKKHSLVYVPIDTVLSNPPPGSETWAMACPANTEEEDQFARKNSFHENKALFVQKTADGKFFSVDLDIKNPCNERFELSMAFTRHKLEFGYEIYYESSDMDEFTPNAYPFHNYRSMNYILNAASPLKNFSSAVLDGKFEGIKLQLNENKQMEFLWIPLFKVWFPSSGNQFQKIDYQITKNNTDPFLPCANFSLGEEMYDEYSVDILYSRSYQKSLFGEFELPEITSEYGCYLRSVCLMKWLLIPSDQFRFGSHYFPSCSNIPTVPIWTSAIRGIMKKLDQYLYVLSRISGQNLQIVAGHHKILTLSKKRRDAPIILETDSISIKVPKRIYKIVKYKSNQCDQEKKQPCWYGVLIVIHNGPYITEVDLICEDMSGKLGWEEIRFETWSYEGAQSQFIYVCEISKETMKNIGLKHNNDTPIEKFSLIRFPYFNDEKKLSFKNIKGEIFEEMKRILDSNAGKVHFENNEIIERPSLDDVNSDIADDDEIVKNDSENDNEDAGVAAKK